MKRTTLIFALLVFALQNHAQNFNPSSESMSYKDNKKYTVDYNTGIFHYQIPITTIELNDYTLPISINYAGRSIKSNEHPGILGYNWALSTGGVVSRVIKGLPDESNDIYEGKKTIGSLELKKRRIDILNKDTSVLVHKHEYDGEHDLFTATFNGKTISFILEYDHNSNKVVAEPLEQCNIKIECNFIDYLSRINSFRIIDESGCEYTFQDREFTTSLYHKTAATKNSMGWHEKYNTSSWYLSSIKTASGNVIEFKYKVGKNQIYNNNSKLNIQYIPSCYEPGSKVLESKLTPLIEKMATYAEKATDEVLLVNSTFPYRYSYEEIWVYTKEFGWQMEYILTATEDIESRIAAEHEIGRLMGLIGNAFKYMDNLYSLRDYVRSIDSVFFQYNNSRYPTVRILLNILTDITKEIGYFLSKAYVSEILNKIETSQTMFSIRPLYISQIISPTYSINFEYSTDNSGSILKSASLIYPISQYPLEQINLEYDDKQQFLKKIVYLNRNRQMYNFASFSYYGETNFTKALSDFWGDNTNYTYNSSDEVKSGFPYYSFPNNKNHLDSKKNGTLQKIINAYGGEIEIDYEDNTVFDWSALNNIMNLSPKTYHGGLRIKSLSLKGEGGTKDKKEYCYPHEGHLLHQIRTHIDRVNYKGAKDIIENSKIYPHDTYLNIGNNGVAYNCVLEKTVGGGATAYYYKNPDPIFDFYESWIVGKLIYKAELDKNNKIKSVQLYSYTETNRNYKELNELKASEYYVSEKDAAKQINDANNPSDEMAISMYNMNILPRTEGFSMYFPDKPIIHYGKKMLLKDQKEYQFEEPVLSFSEMDKIIRGDSINGYHDISPSELEPYLKTFKANLTNFKEFHYDNNNGTQPTRIHSFQSNGDILVERFLTPLEYNGTDEIINGMKTQNIISPVLNKQNLIKRNGSSNYELVKEEITSYNKFNNPAINKSAYLPISLMESTGNLGVNISSTDLSSPLRANVMTLSSDRYRKTQEWSHAYKDNKFIVNQLIKSANRSFHFFNMLSNDMILEYFPKDDVTTSQVDAKNVFCFYKNSKPAYPQGFYFENYVEGSDALTINHNGSLPTTYEVFVMCKNDVVLNCNVSGSLFEKQLSMQTNNMQLKSFDIVISKPGNIKISPKNGFIVYMMISPKGGHFSASCYDKLNRLICQFDQKGNPIYYMYDIAGRMTKTYILEKDNLGQYKERVIKIQKHNALHNSVTSNQK